MKKMPGKGENYQVFVPYNDNLTSTCKILTFPEWLPEIISFSKNYPKTTGISWI